MKNSHWILGLLIVIELTVGLPGFARAVTRDEFTKQECATCHITWLDFFRTEDKSFFGGEWKPALIKETLAVVANDKMCYSCHDGFVRDSRKRVWEGKGHSVGKKPSDSVAIPRSMPLDQKGEIYCGTCHTPHGVGEQTAALTGSVFLRLDNVDSKLCTLCHLSQLEKPGRKNHPVNHLAKNPLPRKIYRMGGKLGSDPRKIICQSCHTPHGKDTLIESANNSSLCMVCHDDKKNSGSLLQGKQPLHPVGVIPKNDISNTRVFQYGAKQGEEGRLICLTCHGIHSGSSLSMILDPDITSFCQGCHPLETKGVSASKHNLLKETPLAKNRDGETPRQSGVCRTCHRAHGWAQIGPPQADSISTLCLGCHREGGAAPKKIIGDISHPVDVDLKTLRKDSSLRPLEKKGGGKLVCTTCHNPHQDRSYDKEPAKKGEALHTFQFLREDKKILCGECHQDHSKVEGTRHDLRLPLEYEDPEIKKRVTQGGPCAACHQIHRAKERYLWALDPSTGKEGGSDLCGSCHNPEKCGRKKPLVSFNHPLDVSCDREIPQALPLFKRGAKGDEKIVACHTCHNPHQWSSDGKKTDLSVEGSPIDSFLRIPDDGESKLCIACHPGQEQVKKTDHDLRQVLEEKDQKMPGSAGVCSGCHLIHSDDPRKKLWTEGLSGEGNETDRACMACHTAEKIAEKKAISTTHFIDRISEGITSKVLPLSPSLPGGEKDLMTCATCHEPHRWEPGSNKKPAASGINIEGTGKDSFLRMECREDSRLCQECHQEKAKVIGTEHDLRIMREKLPGDIIASVRRSGVCSSCHVPHNFSSNRLLWAKKLTRGSNEEQKICFSCHGDNEVAGNKIPPQYNHPEVMIKDALERAKIPFNLDISEKEWQSHTLGNGINCFICHDAHQWSVDQEGEGPGLNTEGDAGSSFLWKKSHKQVCSLCHGWEGLYRYLYFHRRDVVKKAW